MPGACRRARSRLNFGAELLDVLLELTGSVHGLHAGSVEGTALKCFERFAAVARGTARTATASDTAFFDGGGNLSY